MLRRNSELGLECAELRRHECPRGREDDWHGAQKRPSRGVDLGAVSLAVSGS
jgi:hypothetical protein